MMAVYQIKTLLMLAVLISIITSSTIITFLYPSSCSRYSTRNEESEINRVRSIDTSDYIISESYSHETTDLYSSANSTDDSTNVATHSGNNNNNDDEDKPLIFKSTHDSTNVAGHSGNNNNNDDPLIFKSWSRGYITQITPEIRQNCSKLLHGDKEEIQRTDLLHKNIDFHVNANHTSCEAIVEEFSDNFYVSETEKYFPIAFVLVVHTNPQQVIRFLKSIYRPHNHYCIHPDPDSGILNFMDKFNQLQECLPNVFITSRIVKVYYYNPKTIFLAQMSCFRDLLEIKPQLNWKYVINLCGRELPLKTNRHIVESLKNLNGTNTIHSHLIDQYTLEHCFPTTIKRIIENNKTCIGGENVTNLNVTTVEACDNFLSENNLKLYKSMTYNAYSRAFVNFFVNDKFMRELREWLMKNCETPEEHYYAMASVMPNAPWGRSLKTLPAVFKAFWKHYSTSPHKTLGEKCAGKVVHSICILNSAELPRIWDVMRTSEVWFLNKYFMELDHTVMDCMEEQLIESNKQEYDYDQQQEKYISSHAAAAAK